MGKLPRNGGLALDEAEQFYARLFVDGKIGFAEPENSVRLTLTKEERRRNKCNYHTFILRLMQGRIRPADLGYEDWEPE